MKTSKDLKEQFRRLEAAGNDDFELIMLGGPDAYATHELSQLLRQLKVRKIRCRSQQKYLFRLAAMMPVFLLLALLFIGIDRIPLARLCVIASIGIMLVFNAQSWLLKSLINEVENRDVALYRIITRELRRRRSGVV